MPLQIFGISFTASAALAAKTRLERYLRAGQGPRDRAVLSAGRQILEKRLVNTGDVADGTQLNPGDVEGAADLSERHPRGGAQILRGMARLAQQVGERHRVTGGLGRPE